MTDRNVKCFLTIIGLYFVTKDVGAIVLYSRRKAPTQYPKMEESKEKWIYQECIVIVTLFLTLVFRGFQ